MSSQLDHFVETFRENLELLSQQKDSRFEAAVMRDSGTGEGIRVVDQIGEAVSETPTTRFDPKPNNEPPHDARWVHPVDHDWGVLVSKIEQLRKNVLPNGKFVKAGHATLNRDKDDEIISKFFATAKTGKSGGTDTSFPAAQVIAVDEGSSGDTGMNTTKLLLARKLILDADIEIDDPDEQLWCGINPLQEKQLLDQIKVASGDYNKPVFGEDGKTLKHWFGINFILTNRLLTDSNNDFRVPFWAKSGMHLETWQEISGNIVLRPDIKRDPWHISTSGTFGATRLEEVKVVEIICDPTVT